MQLHADLTVSKKGVVEGRNSSGSRGQKLNPLTWVSLPCELTPLIDGGCRQRDSEGHSTSVGPVIIA